jgi:hypothetical protein
MSLSRLCAPCVIGQVIFWGAVGWAVYHYLIR